MSTEPPRRGAGPDRIQERQLTLDDFASGDDGRDRCKAIAASTGKQCRRKAISPFPYCGDHKHPLDEVDVIRMGLNSLKSGD